ncbi:RICIN domain-containing protein [Kitasatospora sp. NBC_01250]|uniref:RICIN domain-containing protein n=1 Tax=Kitasatospora sp. NBC_01250 TaxID=2903571 RepID=UPI002E36403D|nr:RICIN domain-containing protein [Kitasatospora sp. NBC_01250]
MPDPVTAATTDAELARRIRAGDGPGHPAADELARRHRPAVVAYARLCCAQDESAQELADEAIARTLAAVRTRTGPGRGWRPWLLTEVRRTATIWADTARRAELSAEFTTWLDALPRPATGRGWSAVRASVAAESASTLLQAFLSLPPSRQSDLWHHLEQPSADGTLLEPPTPPAIPDTVTRQSLHDAYLQAYLPRAPRRSCRHLLSALGRTVRRGPTQEARELDRHLARCAACRHAHADLTAIHAWERPVLRRALLLWTGEAAAPPAAPAPSVFSRARRPHGGEPRLDGRRLLVFTVVVGAGGLAALVVAGVIVTAVDAAGTHAPLAGSILIPASLTPSPTPGGGSASPPPATATPSPQVSAPVSASASPSVSLSPSPSPSAASAAPSPSASPSPSPSPSPSADAVGFRLVNSSSGLCVGLTGDGLLAVQLQQCTGDASQSWQQLTADQGTFQLRNTGTGQCLDGTTDGGDTVTVTLQACRSDPGRSEQLWRFTSDAAPGSFRLWFLPAVPASAYPAHLLGPQNWAPGDLPRIGSPLVQLPDYYHSASFDFTMG